MKKMLAMAVASALTAAAPLAMAQPYSDRPPPNDQPYAAPDRADAPYDRRDEYRDNGGARDDEARVLDSRPVYGAAGGHEECWNDQTQSYERHPIGAGTVIGGIAGGVVGHQLGNGRRWARQPGHQGRQASRRAPIEPQSDLPRPGPSGPRVRLGFRGVTRRRVDQAAVGVASHAS